MADEIAGEALGKLLRAVADAGYTFVPPTPATHARVVSRRRSGARDLRDIFGWSLSFREPDLPRDMFRMLRDGKALEAAEEGWRSKVRIATIGERYFLHSAYPTDGADAVFFGPDSYRFVDFLRAELPTNVSRVVDMGAGSGVGGIEAAALLSNARVVLLDVNPAALRMAAVNARSASVEIETVEGSTLSAVEGDLDLVLANPPYIVDPGQRAYRDGGDMHGARLSLDWALEAAGRMAIGGRMLLYTGSAIVGGRDALRDALESKLPALGCSLRYREIDPDVFGEELDNPAYADVERIAAIGAVIVREA